MTPESEPRIAASGVLYMPSEPFGLSNNAIAENYDFLSDWARLDEVEARVLREDRAEFCVASVPESVAGINLFAIYSPLVLGRSIQTSEGLRLILTFMSHSGYSWFLNLNEAGEVTAKTTGADLVWGLSNDHVELVRDDTVDLTACIEFARESRNTVERMRGLVRP